MKGKKLERISWTFNVTFMNVELNFPLIASIAFVVIIIVELSGFITHFLFMLLCTLRFGFKYEVRYK